LAASKQSDESSQSPVLPSHISYAEINPFFAKKEKNKKIAIKINNNFIKPFFTKFF